MGHFSARNVVVMTQIHLSWQFELPQGKDLQLMSEGQRLESGERTLANSAAFSMCLPKYEFTILDFAFTLLL